MQMGEGSHSISALLNSCTIFLLRGYCSRLWCEILEGRGGEYNLYSSKPLHSYRNCLWQGKKRKEKKSESLLQQEEPDLTLVEL